MEGAEPFNPVIHVGLGIRPVLISSLTPGGSLLLYQGQSTALYRFVGQNVGTVLGLSTGANNELQAQRPCATSCFLVKFLLQTPREHISCH